MRTAMITGITGQAGCYLAKLLLSKDYRVIGTSRSVDHARSHTLKQLGILDQVRIRPLALDEFNSVLEFVDETRPDEVYHFAGQSSVARSFQDPVDTTQSVVVSNVNLLESVRRVDTSIRLFNAASIEMYGECPDPVQIGDRMEPHSPYGAAKSCTFFQTRMYRQAYDMFCCSGVLTNFESPLRPVNFVTRKIISTALQIANNEKDKLQLGNINIYRDWGWAEEYVDAIWRMLQLNEAEDFVIATGQLNSLERFVELAFSELGIDYQEYIEINPALFRPFEIQRSVGDTKRTYEKLGWKASYHLHDVIKAMLAAETATLAAEASLAATASAGLKVVE